MALLNFPFTVFSNLLAQTNSVASIPKPIGMTSMAGPGNTIITIPINTTVRPTTPTISLFTCLADLCMNSFMGHQSFSPK